MVYIAIIVFLTILIALSGRLWDDGRRLLLNNNRVDARIYFGGALAILLFAVLILTLFSGFRGLSVGADTYSIYYNYFYLSYCVNNQSYSGSEIGFYIILKLGYMLFGSYTGVLITISLITVSFAFAGIYYFRDKLNIVFAFLIYLTFIYFTAFNTMRQYIAVSILFYGLRFVDRKQYIKYLITLAVACTIHNSSIICLIIPCFKLFENKNKVLVGLIILTAIGFIALPTIVDVVVNKLGLGDYASRDYITQINFDLSITNLSIVILYSPAFVIALYFRRKLIAKNRQNKLLLLMLIVAFFCALSKVYMVWLSRIMYYFILPVCVLLPQCITLCETSKGALAFKVFLVIYCLGYFVLNYIILGNGMIYPYVLS